MARSLRASPDKHRADRPCAQRSAPGGEIDLVARDDEDLVIVEVKTRIGDDSTARNLAVTAAKLERLGRLADTYVSREGIEDTPWRVDVVAIVIGRSGRVLRLDHLRGAYL